MVSSNTVTGASSKAPFDSLGTEIGEVRLVADVEAVLSFIPDRGPQAGTLSGSDRL